MDQILQALVEGVVAAHFQRRHIQEQLERCARRAEPFLADETLVEQLVEAVSQSGEDWSEADLEQASALLRELQLSWGAQQVERLAAGQGQSGEGKSGAEGV